MQRDFGMVVKLKFISPHTSFMNWLVKPKYASVAILHIGCQTYHWAAGQGIFGSLKFHIIFPLHHVGETCAFGWNVGRLECCTVVGNPSPSTMDCGLMDLTVIFRTLTVGTAASCGVQFFIWRNSEFRLLFLQLTKRGEKYTTPSLNLQVLRAF